MSGREFQINGCSYVNVVSVHCTISGLRLRRYLYRCLQTGKGYHTRGFPLFGSEPFLISIGMGVLISGQVVVLRERSLDRRAEMTTHVLASLAGVEHAHV